MPNIRRTFPGRSVPVQADDDDNDDEAGGNRSSYHPVSGGGKQFGKSLRPPTNDEEVEDDDDDDEDEDDDDSEEDDEDDSDEDDEAKETKPTTQTAHYAVRRSGKQLAAGAGKYLRPTNVGDDEDDDDDDEEDDEEESAPVVKIQPRPSGKNILRMAPPERDDDEDDDDDDDDDDEDDEVEEVEKPAPVSYRVEGRGGGKSLSRMAPSAAAEDDDENSGDDDDDEEEEAIVQKVVTAASQSRGKSVRQPPTNDSAKVKLPVSTSSATDISNAAIVRTTSAIGGKQLSAPVLQRPPTESSQEIAAPATVSRGPGGGKVLRRPHDKEKEDVVPPKAPLSTISRSPAGGKTLRRLNDEDDNNASAATAEASTVVTSVIARSPAGGKVLRRPDVEDETKQLPLIKPTASIVARSPAGGKVLRAKETDEDHIPKPKQTIGRAAIGGKQLNSSRKVKDDDDDDDEMNLDDDEEDDADVDFEEKLPPQKMLSSRPKRAAAAKAAAKSKIDDEIIGDDDRSSDAEEELDINKTEALIKDEVDRKYLDSLPELEREAILGERFDRLKEKQDMQRAIAEARRKEGKSSVVAESKNKRKSTATKDSKKKSRTEKDEEMARTLAGTRSSARAKDISGAKSKKAAALAALKRQRKIQQDMEESSSDGSELDFGVDDDDSDEDYEEAGLKPWQTKEKATDRSAAKTSTFSRVDRNDGVNDSDMDIDDDDDNDEKIGTKHRSASKFDVSTSSAADAGLEDFLKVTIPRRQLVQWCNEPFFDAAVLECFVRLFIGEDGSGEKVYRLCEIVDVKLDKRSYKFPVTDKNEKPIGTNKFLRLKFGNNERDFPMNLVSDAPPTELDVQKYLTTQKNNRNECLSKRRATKLRRTQDHLVTNFIYTTEDIERSLMQRKKDGKTMSNLGSAQTKIAVAIKGAKDEVENAERLLTESKKALMEFTGASHEENELEKAIEDCTRSVEAARKDLEVLLLEEEKTLHAVKHRTMKLTGREKDQNWAKVNRRAVQINQQVDRESYKVQKEIDARKAAGEKERFNPYARRKVKPKILWEVGQAKDDDDDVNVDNTAFAEAKLIAQTQDTSMERAATHGLLASEASTGKSSAAAVLLVSESHQFVIDEEGLAAQQLPSNFQDLPGAANLPVSNISRLRKGVSIAHYLQRKGLV